MHIRHSGRMVVLAIRMLLPALFVAVGEEGDTLILRDLQSVPEQSRGGGASERVADILVGQRCGLVADGGAAQSSPGEGGTQTTIRLLQVTGEIWTLLCGVVNKDTADKAAGRFAELVQESWKINESMFNGEAQDVEKLDAETYRIAEVYESASYEFESLCRTHCYGSDALVQAFLKAMELGVFGDEEKEKLQLTNTHLALPAAREEIARLRKMEPIDKELFASLSRVKDAPSATKEVPQLEALTKRMNGLKPPHRYGPDNFPAECRAEVKTVYGELEPLLWNIRNEIVRIVALEGYANEPFDRFSDALDSVYDELSATHGECFEGVFDTSFRLDLDDALHGSMTPKP